jgi:ribosomal protein S18 acetylase RimI-like enzyme
MARSGLTAPDLTGAFTVRPARQSDIPGITALDARITSISKGPHWQDLFERSGKSRQAGQFFLVASALGEAGQFLGFIVGEIRAWEFGSAPCGWVYALSVDPDARQHGIGEGLLDAIAAEFKRAGVTKMRTMVAKHNPLPMLFFRAEGMMAGPYIQLEKDLT